jgi:ketosteroid isomerase-like protein
MYHAIVKRRIRGVFLEELSRGDFAAVVSRTAPGVVHTFPGDGALAGTRRSRDALTAWFERLFRLLPVLRFEVDDMVVSGWPWRTLVAACWRNWGEAADGERYENRGCEVFELRWGRAVRIEQYLDTQVVHEHLQRMAAAGIAEAGRPPLSTPLAPAGQRG